MKNFIYFLEACFALVGAWTVFYKLGESSGKTEMNAYYCDNVIKVYSLKEIEDLIHLWDCSEKTKPLIMINPEMWKYFT